jgi:hypothetical protein
MRHGNWTSLFFGNEIKMEGDMKTLFIRGLILLSLFFGGTLCVIPSESEAYNVSPWIDKITLEVTVQKALTKEGNFDLYFKQLELLSEAAAKGDFVAKRKGMNRFLEMLETREGGISQDAAHRIFATVFKVTPYVVLVPMKDKSKLDPEEKALVDRVDRYAAKIKDMEERAALSF